MSQKYPRPLGEGGGEKPAVAGGRFGPYDQEMDARVSVLETHMEYVRSDMAEIKAGLKSAEASISALVATTERLISKIDSFDVRFEAMDAKVEASEARLSAQMAALPTKMDLRNYYMQSLAIGFAFLVLVVGGIVGGLDWIKVH